MKGQKQNPLKNNFRRWKALSPFPSATHRNGFPFPIVVGIVFCLLFSSCGKKSSPKFRQYYVHGQQLYVTHCSNCHQTDGSGLRRVYPPINTSDYMKNNFEEVVCLMRYGKTGELFVDGKQFDQPMHGISSLTDIEVAEIATYIYNTWTHDHGIVEVKEASRILAGCKHSPSP